MKNEEEAEAPPLVANIVLEGLRLSLEAAKTIGTAVSGDVRVNSLEKEIIDCPAFQRLRYIRQLGASYLVYPTANHTRFDHSLGTLAMADRMVWSIRNNTHSKSGERDIPREEEQLIRLLSLLHDIGHVPFGHTLEDEFGLMPRHDQDIDRIQHFVGPMSDIGGKIREALGEKFYAVLHGLLTCDLTMPDGAEREAYLGRYYYIGQLVNDTVCADLLDYLRRDAFFCNVQISTPYRFLDFLYIDESAGVKRLVVRLWKKGSRSIREDILTELIQLLETRQFMAERVYFHHARLIAGTMIAAAVRCAFAAGELTPLELLNMGDDVLLERLRTSKSDCARKLAENVLGRRLWKEIHTYQRFKLDRDQDSNHDQNVAKYFEVKFRGTGKLSALEDLVCEDLGLETGDFLLHCPPSNVGRKLAKMLVFLNGDVTALEDAKNEYAASRIQLLRTLQDNLWAIRGYLNPACMDKLAVARSAFDGLVEVSIEKRNFSLQQTVERILQQHLNLEPDQNTNLTQLAQQVIEKERLVDRILSMDALGKIVRGYLPE